MTLYTSCFKRLWLINEKVIPVNISRWPPMAYQGYTVGALIPEYTAFNMYRASGNWELFEKRYKEQLEKLDPDEIYRQIMLQTAEVPAVLVCHELRDTRCHRILVAEWLTAAGYPTYEWPRKVTPE